MSSETESRKLSDLRVVQLRVELDKRGLDKTGIKQVLVERLHKSLIDEGLDPETYQFDGTDKKSPSKRLSTSSREPADGNNSTLDKTMEGVVSTDTEEPEVATSQPTQEREEVKKGEVKEDSPKEVSAKIDPSQEVSEKSESCERKEEKFDKAENKDDCPDTESIMQLTLEEEEESFHDDEAEVTEVEKQKANNKSDKKSASTNNSAEEADTTKDGSGDKVGQQEGKKEVKTTEVGGGGGASASRSGAKSKKVYNNLNRNLWITNISQTTRATELKQALSEHGKVIGAKVVINARYPGACCYGYVTMETVQDADNCIAKLNNTELNGQIIRIEKVRPDYMSPLKNALKKPEGEDKTKSKPQRKHSPITSKQDNKEETPKKDSSEKDGKKDEKKDKIDEGHKSDTGKRQDSRKRTASKERGREKERRSESGNRNDRSLSSKSKRKDKEVLTFEKIREERDKQRLREKERILREEARRRREEAARQREIERQQRSEAQHLEREREKLRLEREKLEREKAELIRLERERQKLEREKLEFEKLELHRVKLRLQEEDRRAVKRPAPYRREEPFDERKRVAGDRHYDEAPPAPRYDAPPSVKAREPTPPAKKYSSSNKEYKSRLGYEKRESYASKRERDYEPDRQHQTSSSRGPPTSITKYEGSSVFSLSRERDVRDPRPRDNPSSASGSRISKDTRYNERERDRSPHYRAVRDERERRPITDHKPDVRSSRDNRYTDAPKESPRFDRGNTNSWAHSTPAKVFNSGGSNAPPKTWTKDTWRPTEAPGAPDRWNSGNTSRTSLSTTTFSGNSTLNMGPSCPPPPGINTYPSDRFEYKSMGNMRKY